MYTVGEQYHKADPAYFILTTTLLCNLRAAKYIDLDLLNGHIGLLYIAYSMI